MMFPEGSPFGFDHPLIWVLAFFFFIGIQLMVTGALDAVLRRSRDAETYRDVAWVAAEKYPLLAVLYSLRGRIRRSTFWYANLSLAVTHWVIALLVAALAEGELWFGIAVAQGLTIWPSLAVHVKRCHDRNWPGAFMLLGGIPIIGQLWYIVEVGFLPGTSGKNRYGATVLPSSVPP
jgi:uncharacterized membrane protein YhaH (DUF805 family)